MAKSKQPPARKRKAARGASRGSARSAPRKARNPGNRPPTRGVHDIGGLPAGPIDRDAHALTPFEERVDALMMVLTNQAGIYRVDSLRRTIEAFDKGEYTHLAYYEKWILGIRRMLVEQRVLTDAEIDAKVAALKAALARGAAA